MINQLTTRPEYIGALPQELTAESDQILITDQLENSKITIPEGANLTLVALLKEGWEERKSLNFHCQGKGAQVNFIAFILGQNSENFDLETISNHEVPETNAYYYIRSAMFDQSRVNYRGNLVIKPKAQVTDCYLAHHSLMLSKEAKTDTEPCLEIEADDVAAGHAATIGRVDEELLFYLKSRGIDERTAKDILIKAFIETDLSKIPNPELQQLIAQEIEKSLSHYINLPTA